MTRTSVGRRRKDGTLRGRRPVGFLAAWLHAGLCCGVKQEHRSQESLFGLTHDVRKGAWATLAALPLGAGLLALERRQEEGKRARAKTYCSSCDELSQDQWPESTLAVRARVGQKTKQMQGM